MSQLPANASSGRKSLKQLLLSWQRLFIAGLASWLLLTTTLVTLAVWKQPRARAVICMAWGLIILWIIVGGLLMHRFRDPIRRFVNKVPWDWRLKFVLTATLLALLEEAITTTMTNLAPLFGVSIGQAYIAAETSLRLHSAGSAGACGSIALSESPADSLSADSRVVPRTRADREWLQFRKSASADRCDKGH